MQELAAPVDRPYRILLIDDHDVVRRGLCLLLETVLKYQVTEAGSALEGLAVARRGDIDLVLVDARMPDRDGIWALREIRKACPTLPVIVLSTYDSEEYVEGALEAGAAGYLLKEATTEQLNDAINTALHGKGIYLYPAVAQRMLVRTRRANSIDALSAREQEVLELLAHGATNSIIAEKLFVSEKTIKTHLASIFRKLGVTNRTQALSKAMRERLVVGAY